MEFICIDVWLYGPLKRYAGEAAKPSYGHVCQCLAAESTVRQLLDALGMPTEERGITFINGQLSAMPGVQPDLDRVLQDGDRVAFFHLKSMWPFQYRDGASLSPELASVLSPSEGPFHHHHKR